MGMVVADGLDLLEDSQDLALSGRALAPHKVAYLESYQIGRTWPLFGHKLPMELICYLQQSFYQSVKVLCHTLLQALANQY